MSKIAEIIKRKNLTQTQAAALLGMPQPKLSNLLRGRFRVFSERRLMDLFPHSGSASAPRIRCVIVKD